MAMPITVHPILDIYKQNGLLKVARLREMPASWGSIPEWLECSSNITRKIVPIKGRAKVKIFDVHALVWRQM